MSRILGALSAAAVMLSPRRRRLLMPAGQVVDLAVGDGRVLVVGTPGVQVLDAIYVDVPRLVSVAPTVSSVSISSWVGARVFQLAGFDWLSDGLELSTPSLASLRPILS